MLPSFFVLAIVEMVKNNASLTDFFVLSNPNQDYAPTDAEEKERI